MEIQGENDVALVGQLPDSEQCGGSNTAIPFSKLRTESFNNNVGETKPASRKPPDLSPPAGETAPQKSAPMQRCWGRDAPVYISIDDGTCSALIPDEELEPLFEAVERNSRVAFGSEEVRRQSLKAELAVLSTEEGRGFSRDVRDHAMQAFVELFGIYADYHSSAGGAVAAAYNVGADCSSNEGYIEFRRMVDATAEGCASKLKVMMMDSADRAVTQYGLGASDGSIG
jgi:hypothetical protein